MAGTGEMELYVPYLMNSTTAVLPYDLTDFNLSHN